jgi:hypothetical protein
MIHQILIDPTGTELTFIYKNKFFRRMRNDETERTLMISNLINPPTHDIYRELVGEVFPE